MNLLYTSLKSIYDNNKHYYNFVPLEPMHYFFRDFLLKNTQIGNRVIEPLDFSLNYHLDIRKTLDLFLLLSEYGVIEKKYEVTCDVCGDHTIENNIEDLYECIVCKSLMLNLSIETIHDLFNNIKYVFEINEDLMLELRDDIKNPLPSSSFSMPEEEGIETATLNTVYETSDLNLKGISREKEKVLEILDKGIMRIS